MKNYKLYTLALLLGVLVASCSKDDDSAQPASQQQSQQSVNMGRLSYPEQIAPLMRKACSASNCHSGAESVSITSSRLQTMLMEGSFQSRLNAMNGTTSCGAIDNNTLSVLKAWIDQGHPMQ